MEFTPWDVARPIADVHPEQHLNAPRWNAWERQQDKLIRSRLAQGDLDSMINLLLFGTSFTTQPRVRIEKISDASRSGVLRSRVDDLVQGVRHTGNNDRLLFVREWLMHNGIDPDAGTPAVGVFLYSNRSRSRTSAPC